MRHTPLPGYCRSAHNECTQSLQHACVACTVALCSEGSTGLPMCGGNVAWLLRDGHALYLTPLATLAAQATHKWM